MGVPPIKPNIFTKIAKSEFGQKIYKKMLDPKNDGFWNNTMPLIETTTASICYIGATAVQKDIDDKSKKAIQIQNLLSWVASIAICAPLNKGVSKFGKGVVKELEKNTKNKQVIEDLHKVTNGLLVGLPIAVVTLVNRFALPTVFVPVSSIIRDKFDGKRLDVKI